MAKEVEIATFESRLQQMLDQIHPSTRKLKVTFKQVPVKAGNTVCDWDDVVVVKLDKQKPVEMSAAMAKMLATGIEAVLKEADDD